MSQRVVRVVKEGQRVEKGTLSDRFARIQAAASRARERAQRAPVPASEDRRERVLAQKRGVQVQTAQPLPSRSTRGRVAPSASIRARGAKEQQRDAARSRTRGRGGAARGASRGRGRGRGGASAAPKREDGKNGVSVVKRGASARGGGAAGRGKRGGGPRGRGGRSAAPPKAAAKSSAAEKKPTQEELDFELDRYRHQAGRGPEPRQAKLDNELESYMLKKGARDEESRHVHEDNDD